MTKLTLYVRSPILNKIRQIKKNNTLFDWIVQNTSAQMIEIGSSGTDHVLSFKNERDLTEFLLKWS